MLLAIPIGALIGLILGMLGAGGSVLVVPVLVYVFDQTPQQATTASLITVTAGALATSIGQSRAGQVCWGHAWAFLVSALPGIWLGTAIGDEVSGRALVAAFAVFMLLASFAMWRRSQSTAQIGRDRERACPPLQPLRDGAAGLTIGLLTGLLGVGGGFLIVPALAIWLGLTMRTAIGTSLVVITTTGVLGATVHLLSGRSVDPALTALLTVAIMLGALARVAIGRRIPQRALGTSFAVLVASVGGYLIASVAFLGGPPSS